jgi:hypothetical protein
MGKSNMPRTKQIPTSFDSPYFKDVTPLWVGPKSSPIDDIYHPAIDSLARWCGPDWPDKQKTNFFQIRTILLNYCERWKNYDWGKDLDRFERRRTENRQRLQFKSAAERLLKSMRAAPFRIEKIDWVRSLLWSLGSEISPETTNKQVIQGLEQSIEQLVKLIESGIQRAFVFGPLGYARLPKALPRKDVAIALQLADVISMWRRDQYSSGTMLDPHKPNITKNLPWKAIAEFAAPPGLDPDDFLNPGNVQMLVSSLSRSIAHITIPRPNPQ